MKIITEIIKQIFYIIFNFSWNILKHSWEPILTILIKISILALVLWLITSFIPHEILLISNISYIGWFTLLCVYNLLTFKIDDNFNSEYNEVLNMNSEVPEIQTEEDLIEPPKQVEIKVLKDLISNTDKEKIDNDNESTRE